MFDQQHGDMRPSPAEASRSGVVLETARMRKELDANFIRYLCGELSPARNPVLHGRRHSAGCVHEAARKLATMEYIIKLVERRVTERVIAHFQKHLPPELHARIMEAAHRSRAEQKATSASSPPAGENADTSS